MTMSAALTLDPSEADPAAASGHDAISQADLTTVVVLETTDTLAADDADLCYIVDDGALTLTLEVLGRRLELMIVGNGGFFCGYSGPARLMARTSGTAMLRQIPLSALMHTNGDVEKLSQQSIILDRWIESLAAVVAGAAAAAIPATHNNALIALADGESRQIAGGTVVTSKEGVIWLLRQTDGGLLAPTPLTASSMLAIEADTLATTSSTLSLQLLPDAADAVKAYMSQALAEPAERLLKAAACDADRVLQRSNSVTRSTKRALDAIAGALDEEAHTEEYRSAADDDCPVHEQIALIAHAQGYLLRPSKRMGKVDTTKLIEATCTANNVRWRSITLSGKWWKTDSGDFLALKRNGQAVAVIRRARYYVVCDGPDGAERPFTPILAEDWTGAGYALYWPLPEGALNGLDVISRVVRGCASDIATLMFASAIVGVLALALPVAAGFMVGTIIPNEDGSMLVEFGLILTAVAVTNFVITLVSELATSRIEMRATTLVQSGIIDRLLRLPTTFFRGFSSGELTQRAIAISRLERLVTSGMIGGLLCGVFSFLSFGLMFVYSPSLALLTTGLSLLFIIVAIIAGRIQTAANRDQVLASGPVSSLMFEMAQGIEKLRVTATESSSFERWSHAFRVQQSAAYRAKRVAAGMNTFSTLFLSAATLTVFVYVGNIADGPAISPASLVTFLTCFTTFIAGLGQLAVTATQIAGMRPLYEFAAPILRATPENDVGGIDPGVLRGSISFNGVRFAYSEDGPEILDGVDLHIEAGEYIAIVGDSGCGKSTILRLLMAFETPRSGTVTVDGFELHSVDKRALRRQFGVVMQNARLMPGTIYDNIVGTHYGMSLTDVANAAQRVGLADDIRDMPMGYQTAVSESTGGLSGGQIQRILLARAIVSAPAILILDEATSALDNRTQSIVTRTLDELTSTRIVVAHRLSTIIRADRIVVLSHGRVVENGTYEELMAIDGHFAAMARRQLI